VALSRLTSLDGLILYSRINQSAIHTDERVIAFTQKELAPNKLAEILKKEQAQYLRTHVINSYDWSKLVEAIEIHWEGFSNRQIINQNESQELFASILTKVKAQHDVANKFTYMLGELLKVAQDDQYKFAQSRIESATNYFIKAIDEEILTPISSHLDDMKNRAKVVKYVNELRKLIKTIQRKKTEIEHAVFIIQNLANGINEEALLSQIADQQKEKNTTAQHPIPKEKAPKGESQRISLAMYKAGQNIAQIAEERNMAIGTIETHLLSFVPTGELAANEILEEDKYFNILGLLNENPELNNTELKEKLGEEYSWFELRVARAQYSINNPTVD
jgi:hypothetical protein